MEGAKESKWDAPVERKSRELTQERNDCTLRFWTWVLCGGPRSRLEQMYVKGKLDRCMDEYLRFKDCLVGKMRPEKKVKVEPEPHPLWSIRSRREASDFWAESYEHLGATRATDEDIDPPS